MRPAESDFSELSALLLRADAGELLRAAPQLCRAIPELAPTVGFDQRSPHHAYDVFTHTAHVLEAVPEDLVLRWAALLHDLGKIPTFTQDATGRGHFYGHAQAGAEMADAVLRRLEAPEELREQAVFLIARHMTRLQPDREALASLLRECGAPMLHRLLLLQKADMASKGMGEDDGSTHFARVQTMLEELEMEYAN